MKAAVRQLLATVPPCYVEFVPERRSAFAYFPTLNPFTYESSIFDVELPSRIIVRRGPGRIFR